MVSLLMWRLMSDLDFLDNCFSGVDWCKEETDWWKENIEGLLALVRGVGIADDFKRGKKLFVSVLLYLWLRM